MTGSPRVPVGGCANFHPHLQIQLIKDNRKLPSASTCFNLLKLPVYADEQTLKQKLEWATTEGLTGFALS
jgi:ubiquitin-protein ligase E3 C